YWRDLTHMPEIMPHLERVEILDERRSRRVAKGPDGAPVEWVAEITEDTPNESIATTSEAGAAIENSRSTGVEHAPADKGTEVRLEMHYNPPGGALADLVARLFGDDPAQAVAEGLRRFKCRMETGEIATIEGQPRGTCSGKGASAPKPQR